jgi:ABC-type Fe3+-hydroxamate transport system substrate-binding protein
MNKFAKLLGVSVLSVAVMAACGQSAETEDASAEVQKKVDESNGNTGSEEKAEEKAAEGDTINVDGAKITVVSIEPFDGRINEFQPIENDHAVKVNVIVENTNTESYFVDNTEFGMYDTEGFELTQALPGEENPLSSEIPGGKKVEGAIYFDVPQQDGNWELHYTSIASFDGDAAVWELPAK